MKMIVDVSSVCWMSLYAGKDGEHGKAVKVEQIVAGETVEKSVWVNSAHHGYENGMNHLCSAMRKFNLKPSDMVFVVEGEHSKAMRKEMLRQYKETRDTRPPEAYTEFNNLKAMLCDAFRNVGAQVVTQIGVEADDVIAYLCRELDGEKVILTNDGDLAVLVDKTNVHLYRQGEVDLNPYGPFPFKYITVYKALVGDSSDNIPGAYKFGEKTFLKMYAAFDDAGLQAMEDLIITKTLGRLNEDVADMPELKRIIDDMESVYKSYAVAKLYPEQVNKKRTPLNVVAAPETWSASDERLQPYLVGVDGSAVAELSDMLTLQPGSEYTGDENHAVFDVELIGTERPVFLVCVRVIETNERHSFWLHKGQMPLLEKLLRRKDLVWVSFNGNYFDSPLISAAIGGRSAATLKTMANELINEGAKPWQLPNKYDYTPVEFKHIDLIEPAPGVMVSLKTYAGRLGIKTMIDLPFHHDKDLTEEEMVELENYCMNDLESTELLFNALKAEMDLRDQMSREYDIDLRSKSDAQVAEAVLKKEIGLTKSGALDIPVSVRYKAPEFISTNNKVVLGLIEKLEATEFQINRAHGGVEAPAFLKDEVKLGWNTYQLGIGGIHSTRDKALFVRSNENMMISDIDVASYYPNIMLKAGLIPRLGEGKGEMFIEAYAHNLQQRMVAKRRMQELSAEILAVSENNTSEKIAELKAEVKRLKSEANTRKLLANGTFGKLGSMYSAFYSPDLLIAVTLSGQLNLLCLIAELEAAGATVLSANTDGMMLMYAPTSRDLIFSKVHENAKRTGFEYEETPYRTVAMKDVNNYIAITDDRRPYVISSEGIVEAKSMGVKAKAKGLYASNDPAENPLFLMKNPTNEVCSKMAREFLRDGVHPSEAIDKYSNMRDFVAIRNVKGGGIQYDRLEEVDDWILVNDLGTKDNEWQRSGDPRKAVKRKSRPAPVEVGVGGKPFGRLARWYMTTDALPPICYVGSGNRVPKTEGGKLCMSLPDTIPADLDKDWYVNETLSMLADMGVKFEDQD